MIVLFLVSSNIKFREAKEKCNNLNVVQRSQQDRKTLTSKSMNSSSKLLTHQQAKATPEYATTSLLSFSTAPTLENSIGHKSSSNSSNKRPLEGDENNLLLLYI